MNEREIHFEGKIAQKVIVERGDKILLVQDPRVKNDIWELPSGRMNIDEVPQETVKREFIEEMGVSIDVHEVVYMQQFFQHSDQKQAFVIVYRASLVATEKPFQLADEEVSHYAWFSAAEIEALQLFPEYKKALGVYLSK